MKANNRYVSQLSIFARIVQNDFSYAELLDFVPLHDTTKSIDIFNGVEQTLQKFNADFFKCSTIVTLMRSSDARSKNRFLWSDKVGKF